MTKVGYNFCLSEMQGVGEQHTEAYLSYDEGAAQQTTQQLAKSTVAKSGFARISHGTTKGVSHG